MGSNDFCPQELQRAAEMQAAEMQATSSSGTPLGSSKKQQQAGLGTEDSTLWVFGSVGGGRGESGNTDSTLFDTPPSKLHEPHFACGSYF